MISATYFLILCHFLMISTLALSQKSGNGTNRFPGLNNPDQWHWGDFGEIGGHRTNGSAGNGGTHVLISAREIARLGLLFLNQGAWEGKQLLPREWVRQACSVQLLPTLLLGHTGTGLTGSSVYGLNWWVNGICPTGERKWPDAPTGTFAALGHHNNYFFVIPEWDMVLVRLGLDQSDRIITDAISNQFTAKIGEALSDVRKKQNRTATIKTNNHEKNDTHNPGCTFVTDLSGNSGCTDDGPDSGRAKKMASHIDYI